MHCAKGRVFYTSGFGHLQLEQSQGTHDIPPCRLGSLSRPFRAFLEPPRFDAALTSHLSYLSPEGQGAFLAEG